MISFNGDCSTIMYNNNVPYTSYIGIISIPSAIRCARNRNCINHRRLLYSNLETIIKTFRLRAAINHNEPLDFRLNHPDLLSGGSPWKPDEVVALCSLCSSWIESLLPINHTLMRWLVSLKVIHVSELMFLKKWKTKIIGFIWLRHKGLT